MLAMYKNGRALGYDPTSPAEIDPGIDQSTVSSTTNPDNGIRQASGTNPTTGVTTTVTTNPDGTYVGYSQSGGNMDQTSTSPGSAPAAATSTPSTPMSTAAKVGIGVGVAAVVGGLAFAIFR